jgi:CheY-like chemotaxis protein
LLGRILRNLVSNAIKYTGHGRILIGCRRRGDRVRIEVWDTGCGIAAEQQQQIFWEFVQLEEKGQHQGGLGLGLAIVDRLAKSLGYHVEVRSWPGRGSVFAIDMPLVGGESVAPIEVASMRTPDGPLASKLIAVIDDDESVTKAMSSLLRSWGATAVCAADGDELLRALSGRRPDAVIADRKLARGSDGFAVLDNLEAHLGGTLPSLILTGEYDIHGRQLANIGRRRVLRKPVWDDALLSALRFELSRSAQM